MMYEIIFMEEAAHSSVVNMPMPKEEDSEEYKQRFVKRYLDPVLEKYKVMIK